MMRESRIRKFIRADFCLGLLLCLVTPLSLADQAAAELVVQETTDEMLVLIAEGKTYADDDPERFYANVEALLETVVDFPRFARSVMAAYYKDATPEQRIRFSDSFKNTLVRTYALALTEFDGGEVVIIPEDRPARAPNRATVKQEIRTSRGDVYPVVYSMAYSDDAQWQLRNIIVNGVNMGLTYRNQFASTAQDARYDGDMNRIIDAWMRSVEQQAAEDLEAAADADTDAPIESDASAEADGSDPTDAAS